MIAGWRDWEKWRRLLLSSWSFLIQGIQRIDLRDQRRHWPETTVWPENLKKPVELKVSE